MIHFLRLKLVRLLLCLGTLGVLSTPVLAETVLAKYLAVVWLIDADLAIVDFYLFFDPCLKAHWLYFAGVATLGCTQR